MVTKETLGKAIAFAVDCHKDQFDKGGNPYILHPLHVMNKLIEKYPDDIKLHIVGVCHDTIEDKFANNHFYGFSVFANEVTNDPEVNLSLELVTKKKNQSYSDYINGIYFERRATLCKLEDLKHNSDITRLKGLTNKDFDRIKKYHASYCVLSGQSDKLLDLI